MIKSNLNYSIIINSIGSASPIIAKFLSDSFNIKQEIILRMLYCTPSLIFHNIDKENAQKASELLRKLGLEIIITESNNDLPELPDLYDICLYINDPVKLPIVTEQLAEFLGCTIQEAFNLLLNEPSVVLGNVSKNTALALSNRIDAEVVISKPREDLYTLSVLSADLKFLNQLKTVLNSSGIEFNPEKERVIENIGFEKGREIWRCMNSSNNLSIYNQSFQRYEIVLNEVDKTNQEHSEILNKKVGIPKEIINDVLKNLPVVLNESVNRKDLQDFLLIYKKAGLKCTYNPIRSGDRQIIIESLTDKSKAEAVINQFFPGTEINENVKPWILQKPVKPLIARYIGSCLEQLGCVVEQKYLKV